MFPRSVGTQTHTETTHRFYSHTYIHTNPSGCYVTLQCNLKGLETEYKLLIVRRERKDWTPYRAFLKRRERCRLYFRKMFFPQRRLLDFFIHFSLPLPLVSATDIQQAAAAIFPGEFPFLSMAVSMTDFLFLAARKHGNLLLNVFVSCLDYDISLKDIITFPAAS